MVVKRQCSFCAGEIEPGTGLMFVKRDGSIFHFCSGSCRKQQLGLGRVGHRLKWTRAHAVKREAASAHPAAPAAAAAAPPRPASPPKGARATKKGVAESSPGPSTPPGPADAGSATPASAPGAGPEEKPAPPRRAKSRSAAPKKPATK